ncbi:hypothetical protein [Bradyrhizobium sp. AZCC 1708]|uniref:hypothetical protein n=1 Tax=Bradyrhizobium sp. AZCC 1708 TaxID=3117015 RepID=UPI002FF0A02A
MMLVPRAKALAISSFGAAGDDWFHGRDGLSKRLDRIRFGDASADTLEPVAIRGWPATGAAGGDLVVGHYSDRRDVAFVLISSTFATMPMH